MLHLINHMGIIEWIKINEISILSVIEVVISLIISIRTVYKTEQNSNNRYHKKINSIMNNDNNGSSLISWNDYLKLYNKETSLNYKQSYFYVLVIIAILTDTVSLFIKRYYRDFMTLGTVVFGIFVIIVSYSLSNKSLQKLENTHIKRKLLNKYSPVYTIMVAYGSLITVAFKSIPLVKTSPIALYGYIGGSINMLPIYFVQILFILSLITVKNGIVSHCNQKIANYKINQMYDNLIQRLHRQQKEIRHLIIYKNHTEKLKKILKHKRIIYKHLLKLLKRQQTDTDSVYNYIKYKL